MINDKLYYVAVTDNIQVEVRSFWLEEKSSPEDNLFFWIYIVRIKNLGKETIQLLRRYWKIVDSDGSVKEVRGNGVVGEQPHILPGEAFKYTSGTPLNKPSGIMSGTYSMLYNNGKTIEVIIPSFSLDSPYQNTTMN